MPRHTELVCDPAGRFTTHMPASASFLLNGWFKSDVLKTQIGQALCPRKKRAFSMHGF